jgi:cobalt-zinc-cadmium efflux system membrane fusion protein
MTLNTKYLVLMAVIATTTAATFAAGKDDDHGHDHGKPPVATTDAAAKDEHGHAEAKGEHAHAEPAQGHTDEVKLTPEAVRRNGIKVEQAKRRELSDTFVVPARLDFNREAMAHVGAAVRGRVVEMNARVGDRVNKGDVLLAVESPELGEAQSDYLQKRTAVRVAEATVEPLKVSYERGKALHDKNEGVALAEVQKREADYRAAVGAVEMAKAAAAAAENRLHLYGVDQAAVDELVKTSEVQPRYAVRAPIGGQVIAREVTLGELVAPEKEALLVLANTDELWVLADVPEAALGQLETGAAAQVVLGAMPDRKLAGKVSHVAPSIDPATRTARVRIVVPNDGGVLRPGMFARAAIAAGGRRSGPALAVPDEAVQTVEGKPAVFVPVAGEEHTFAKREVEVGEVVGGMVPILAGLKEGEAYVASGSFILKAELGKGAAAHEH